MDQVEKYRQIIEDILNEYAEIPYAYGQVKAEVVADRQNDHYLMLAIGWEGAKRVHGCIVHVDIINGKVWIQQDGTEHGIADDLIERGIPKTKIILGFHAPHVRQHTGFATA